MRAGNPAGTTFQTPLVIDTYVVCLQAINICRTEIKTGLFLTLIHAFLPVNYPKVTFFIYLKTV
jgi:hypothetical protein